MLILGIETSCDETGVAIYSDKDGLLAHSLHSQIAMHAEYGGVVPELASRDHVKRIIPLIDDVLQKSNLELSKIDAIAYTAGPGLVGALLVGAMEAEALAFSLGIPSIPVHHMEGHLLAPMLEDPNISFPFVALLVSGGHTMLIKVTKVGDYEILGQSVDDAVGEAFDKTAKLLGLPYPGGPHLERLAVEGDSTRFKFPRPMLDKPNLDFSFAGLKTAVLTEVKKSLDIEKDKSDIAKCFIDAVTDTLSTKCQRALDKTNINNLVVAGGVSANLQIRESLTNLMTKRNGKVFFARREFCTDNGAMIALAGMMRCKSNCKDDSQVNVYPRWPLTNIE